MITNITRKEAEKADYLGWIQGTASSGFLEQEVWGESGGILASGSSLLP